MAAIKDYSHVRWKNSAVTSSVPANDRVCSLSSVDALCRGPCVRGVQVELSAQGRCNLVVISWSELRKGSRDLLFREYGPIVRLPTPSGQYLVPSL